MDIHQAYESLEKRVSYDGPIYDVAIVDESWFAVLVKTEEVRRDRQDAKYGPVLSVFSWYGYPIKHCTKKEFDRLRRS